MNLSPAALLDRVTGGRGNLAIRYTTVSLIGVTITQVQLLLYVGILDQDPTWSNVIAVSLCSIPVFLLNKHWVWNADGKLSLRREILPFWVFTLAGLGLSTALVAWVETFSDSTLLVMAANIGGFGHPVGGQVPLPRPDHVRSLGEGRGPLAGGPARLRLRRIASPSMSTLLPLDPDELLSTTRSVRKRLDLSRPVAPELLRECIEVATQAPTGGNNQGWHFVVVTDQAKRTQLAEWYAPAFAAMYGNPDAVVGNLPQDDPDYVATTKKVIGSAQYLADHLAEVPVHVIPCIEGRTDNLPVAWQAAIWGSLLPAVWSFMLAARARGLGTCWTTLHLTEEKAAAELLGIPDHVMQGALIPVAHTLGGTDFKPGARRDLDRIIHTDGW